MYVINEKTKIVNRWSDNEVNRARLSSKKYGVIEYTGEVESGFDGRLYAKGFTPIPPIKTYVEKRIAEYPPISEQLDMIFHDIDNWRNKINEIKNKYPKE